MSSDEASDDQAEQITIDFRRLDGFARIQLLHILIRYSGGHPIHEHVFACTQDQLEQLTAYMNARLSFAFGNLERDLRHHRTMIERDLRFDRLLRLGASKRVLRSLFAKSHREIDRRRRNLGLGAELGGRPRKLDRHSDYEIAARWELLREEEMDLAEILIRLAEEFPSQDINSIFRSISELDGGQPR